MSRGIELEFSRTHKRLEDWGDWINASGLSHYGWNVYNGDSSDGVRVQNRNDTHSDKVFSEVANMGKSLMIATTDTAWRELPRTQRRLLWSKYVLCLWPQSKIARSLGMKQQDISRHMRYAIVDIDAIITGMNTALKSLELNDDDRIAAVINKNNQRAGTLQT